MKRPDYGLLAAVGILVVFGLVMLASATGPTGFQRFGDTYHFLKRQVLFGVIPGVILLLALSKVPVSRYQAAAPFLFPAALALLALGFIPGLSASYGSGSWIQVLGLSFQPSETAKLLLILYFAWWLDRRGERHVRRFHSGLLPFVITLGIIVGMMLLQSDLGTTAVMVAIFFAMYIAAGAPFAHVAALLGASFFLFLTMIKIAPYRADRLKIFLRPELDPQGVGYHINQALLAIGTGGWFGLGLGKSRQKFQYLPEVAGDSIFAVIAEEMGFLVSAGLIAAYLYFVWKGFKIAERSGDDFSKFAAVGITVWIGFQAILNISAMVGLMPLTGVPLPFVSHGGSAMLSNLAAVGVLAAISREGGVVRRRGSR